MRLLKSGHKFTALFCVNDQTGVRCVPRLVSRRLELSARCFRGRFRRPAFLVLSSAAAHLGAPIDSRAGREARARPCFRCCKVSNQNISLPQVQLMRA